MLTRLLGSSVILAFTILLAACNANAAPKTPIPPAKVDVALASSPGKQTAVSPGAVFRERRRSLKE